MKKIFLSILMLHICFTICHAQVWYFGYKAGINFNNGGTVSSHTGNLLNSLEGTAITNDQNGNLLFYTNGDKIIDRNGNVMNDKFGNDADLNGDPGSTQSAIIIPVPSLISNCEKKYYIFNVGEATTTLKDGLFYSIVEFDASHLDGYVSSLNNSLIGDTITEKITAFNDGLGGYWVLAHGFDLNISSNNIPSNYVGDGNLFHKFHLTPTNPIPNVLNSAVYSSQRIGNVHCTSTWLGSGEMDAAGQMKFSITGRRLALALYSRNIVDLLDFNQTTGILSNFTPIDNVAGSVSKAGLIYGLEFSPDENFLYASSINGANTGIFQFNLSSSPISKSKLVSGASNTWCFGLLQLGPDSRIYCANQTGITNYLSVIANPNRINTTTLSNECGFIAQGIKLVTGTSSMGLPTVIQNESKCGVIDGGTCECIFPKIRLFSGHPKLNGPSENLDCNNHQPKPLECYRNYWLVAEPGCSQGCEGRIDSIQWRHQGIITTTGGGIRQFSVSESGDYEAWIYSVCGDKACNPCKINFTVVCSCPPPECCKDKPEVSGNSINISQTLGGTMFNANLNLTANINNTYSQVRLQLLDVQLGSENNNPACIECLKNLRQWGSITSALLNGFSTKLQSTTGNNRSAEFNSSVPQSLQGRQLMINMMLPPKSTLESCKLYADVYIKITVRDNQCRECDTIISGRVNLTDLKWGSGENGNENTSPSNNRKSKTLFPNTFQFKPIPNQRTIRTAGIK